MRKDALLKLLEIERSTRSEKPKLTIPVKLLDSVLYSKAPDEDIIKYVVPFIVDMELVGECSKDKIKNFISSHKSIKILPAPVRHEVDSTVAQRRMDSLARLLSLNINFTPCVAVTFYNGVVIVGSNAPNPRSGMSSKTLAACIDVKMRLIRVFLTELATNLNVERDLSIEKILFSTDIQALLNKTALQIMDDSNGGIGDVLPRGGRRHKSRKDTESHVKNALLKLGHYCLLGLVSRGDKGFSLDELKTLIDGEVTMAVPETALDLKGQLHAEQAILFYLKQYKEFNSEALKKKINIGISKLCCQACHHVLSQSDKISYRGSHGMRFPNVHNIHTQKEYEGIPTQLGEDLCPTDSDSEIEDDEFVVERDTTYTSQLSKYSLFNVGVVAKSKVDLAPTSFILD